MRERLAAVLRRIADRIDRRGSPKRMYPWSFTFQQGHGIVFNQEGRGCPLWYYGTADYERAHAEAFTAGSIATFD